MTRAEGLSGASSTVLCSNVLFSTASAREVNQRSIRASIFVTATINTAKTDGAIISRTTRLSAI
jgi:hypothetical protein